MLRSFVHPTQVPYSRADDEAGPQARATFQSVLPGYLRVAGVDLLAGRDFTDDDIVHQRRGSSSTSESRIGCGRRTPPSGNNWPLRPVARRHRLKQSA